MRRKLKTYYHTPLNLSKTIELPSNLLQKPSSESKKRKVSFVEEIRIGG